MRIEKPVEYESDGNNNCNWCSWYSHQKIDTWTGGFGNKRTNGDHPNYSFIKIGQNAEKSPGDLRRLAATQTPIRKYRLMLLWKTLKRVILIIVISTQLNNEKTFILHKLIPSSICFA